MKKQKPTEQFALSELHQLRIENVLLKMADTQVRARNLNQQFAELAQVRDGYIEDARKEVGAPEDFMVNGKITAFIPPPPAPCAGPCASPDEGPPDPEPEEESN